MTHVWQWNGGGATPLGLIEGIADFIRMKAGYESTSSPVRLGEGDRGTKDTVLQPGFLGIAMV
ncbi:unnamed protein product [Linum tenue]|nr:unnamed protein product [Linum tenue]